MPQRLNRDSYSNLCSEQVTGEGRRFITFSHLLPGAMCRALMGCRNIITALMHMLTLSSFDLLSSVFQDSKFVWRDDLQAELSTNRLRDDFSDVKLCFYSPAVTQR